MKSTFQKITFCANEGTIVGMVLLGLEDLVLLYFVLVDRSHSYGTLVRLTNNQLNNQSIFCFVYHLFFFS